jgi:hypothetical protein
MSPSLLLVVHPTLTGTKQVVHVKEWTTAQLIHRVRSTLQQTTIVSVMSGGENGGQESRTSYGRISIIKQVPLDHRYQSA